MHRALWPIIAVLALLLIGIGYLTADLCGWLDREPGDGGWYVIREDADYVWERLDGTSRERKRVRGL